VRFEATRIRGVFVIEQERHADERGFFARTWCAEEFERRGLEGALSQCSVSFNERRGTLRGLHYQVPPFAEVKLVRCTRGAVYDVALDLRPDSGTFREWVGVELTEDDGRALYIPRGVAHGCYVTADRTEVAYQIAGRYEPEAARGIRWNDPFHDVEWPGPAEVLSAADRDRPDVDVTGLAALRGLSS
jgi:dTDP-4-dehydrorhamnose 3,5-epimerase